VAVLSGSSMYMCRLHILVGGCSVYECCQCCLCHCPCVRTCVHTLCSTTDRLGRETLLQVPKIYSTQ
jgi:hypothetical protein